MSKHSEYIPTWYVYGICVIVYVHMCAWGKKCSNT